MSKLWILTRILIKNNLSSLSKKKTKVPPVVFMILLMGIFVMSFSVPLGVMMASIYDTLAQLNLQSALLTVVIACISFTVFLFGIFYVLSIFYFARDVELLLPLPLKSGQILGAKFLSVLIYEYLTELIILMPALVVFAMKGGVGPLFYLYSVLIFLLVPVVPLVLASIINMVVMRFTNIGKHKDALRIVGGLLAFAFAIGINMLSQNIGKVSENSRDIASIIGQGQDSLASMTSKFFPPAKFAALSILESDTSKGLMNLLIFVVITLAFLGIFFILAEAIYFKGVLGNAEVYSRRKKLSGEQFEKNLRQNSAIRAFTMKELRILFRTPAYVMNCVIGSFMWPVFMVIGLLSSGGLKEIQSVSTGQIFSNNRTLGIMLAVIFVTAVVLTGSGGIASTSISREGQSLYVSKYVPLKFSDQIWARILPGIIFSTISIIFTLGIVYVLIGIPLVIILLGIIVIILGMFFASFVGIFLELKFPKLNWDNEQKAVKQNINFMITMFGSWAVGALCIYLIAISGLQLLYVFSTIVGVFGLIDLCLYYAIMNIGQKWFNKIEL